MYTHYNILKTRTLFLLLALTYFFIGAKAQNAETVSVTVNDSTGASHTENFELPPSLTYPIDSLLAEWQVKNYVDLSKDCSTSDSNPFFTDSVYIDRLSRIPAVIEMPFNEIVRNFIDTFTGRQRNRFSLILSLCNFYIPIFEEALNAYNLPLELKYLPIIESSLNPNAVSRAGASGLWQFMLNTGKLYDLESNSLVDERRDPIKASWAAARYLKDMYDIYQDWNLVIAAYNCGPGNINKAISRSGGKHDYWEIYNYLPRETRGYIPSFIAANYVMTYYCKHNICPMETNVPDATDTIQVNKNIHFQQIADVCGIDFDQIKSLNPQYKRNIIPGETKPQTLRLPQNFIGTFLERQDSVCAYKSEQFFKNRRIVVATQPTKSQTKKNSKATAASANTTYHTIRSGETLSVIAKKYGVTVNQIKSWNGMTSTRITAGKRLRVSN